MKTYLKLGAAALAMVASTAMAQTGNGSDVTGGTVSSTVNGVFSPTGGGGGGSSFTAPSSTPVVSANVGSSASVSNVVSGNPAAVATFTASLTSAGIPNGAAFAAALTSLTAGGSMTFGNVATAVNAWNAAVSSLTQAQQVALVRSPAGRAAFAAMHGARIGAIQASVRAR